MHTSLTHRQPWFVSAVILSSAAAIFACALLPQIVAIAVPLLIAGAIVLMYPAIGLMVMMVLFLIQASPLYTDYGVFARSLTAADGLAALVLAGYLLQGKRSSRHPALGGRRGVVLLLVFAYFTWQIISIFWSPASVSALLTFVRDSLEAVLLFSLAIFILDDRTKVRRAAGMYALAGTGLALYTIHHFQSKGGFSAAGNLLYQGHAYRGGYLGAFNSNELAIILLLVPAFAYLAAAEVRHPIVRLLVTGVTVPIVGLALIVLTSREALIAAAAAVLAGVVLARGVRYRVSLFGVAALGLAVFAFLSITNHLPYYFLDRITQASYDNFGSRLPGWEFGLQLFAQNPIAGAGALGFETIIPSYHITVASNVTAPHNDYIGALADGGLIGFALLIAMLAAIGLTIVFGGRRNPAAIAIFVILGTALASGSFVLTHWFWVGASIACCFGLTEQAEGARESELVPDPVHGNFSAGRPDPEPTRKPRLWRLADTNARGETYADRL